MTVKLALLKSGEDIVADIQEIIHEEKVIGYFFNKPCVVTLNSESENKSFKISLFPWIPITKTTKVPVPSDWVITIVDPIDSLDNMYKQDVLKNDRKTSEDDSFNEQSDSNIGD